MRRQDRMVTDIDEIKEILNSTRIIHLGMLDGDYPYVLPLHFGYEFIDEVLYIYVHGHYEGKKFDLIQGNPHVFIEIDGSDEAMVNSVGVVQIKVVDYTAKRRRQLEQDVIMPPLTK